MFNNLQTLKYPYDGGVELAGLILANMPVRLNIDRSYILDRKYISDGETAEGLAWKLWRRPDFHWVLLYINAIVDPYTGWPMRDGNVHSYANAKYGFETMDKIRHFVDLTNDKIIFADYTPPYPANLHPVSYLEHERNLNNAKRAIVAITPKYIHDFVDTYNELILGKTV